MVKVTAYVKVVRLSLYSSRAAAFEQFNHAGNPPPWNCSVAGLYFYFHHLLQGCSIIILWQKENKITYTSIHQNIKFFMFRQYEAKKVSGMQASDLFFPTLRNAMVGPDKLK